ncbi:IS3 family transposase, partial [Fluviibacterium sp. DFM31]
KWPTFTPPATAQCRRYRGRVLLRRLQTERVRRKTYRTRKQARADVFDYIERFYNPTRRHSTIGYLSPMTFEERAMKA